MENSEPLTNNIQPDYLADVETSFNEFIYASQGQRFLNWLIDNLFINYIIGYGTGILLGIILQSLAPDYLYNLTSTRQSGGWGIEFYLLAYSIAIVNYMFYYTLSEKIFKGYTLGKLITGSRAIRQDGQELTIKDAALRSISRCVPFEVFSGFSTLTWHDSWTDTMVVKSR